MNLNKTLYTILILPLLICCSNGSSNSYENYKEQVADVTITQSENDNDTINIILTSKTENAIIYYTLDNSEPTLESKVYVAPLNITQDTIVKAFAAKKGYKNSRTSELEIALPKDYILTSDNYLTIVNSINNVTSANLKVLGKFSNDYLSKINSTLNRKKIMYSLDLSEAEGIYMGKWQFNNSYIKEIILPEGLSEINEQAFDNCACLRKITLPSTITKIYDKAFYGCPKLTTVVYQGTINQWLKIKFNTHRGHPLASVQKFYVNGSELTHLIIPNGVTRIERFSFYGCSPILSVSFPNSLTFIGADSFYGCKQIKNLSIPDSVKTIESGAFRLCSELENIQLPSGITKIADHVFQGCRNLLSIEIPTTVTTIGDEAFYYCKKLTSITISSNISAIGKAAFQNSAIETALFTTSNNWMYGYVSSGSSIDIGPTIFTRKGEINGSDLGDIHIAADYLSKTYSNWQWRVIKN